MITLTSVAAAVGSVLLPGLLSGTLIAAGPAAESTDASCAVAPSAHDDLGGVVDGRNDPAPAEAAAWERATQQRLTGDERPRRVVIPVAWHVVREGPAFWEGNLERSTVRAALRQIGRAYRGAESDAAARTPFRFELVGLTRTTNEEWFADLRYAGPEERAMKTALRTGGPETLNVYSVRPVAGVGGWATFPQEYPEDPIMDGVVIHFGSVPGGFIGGQGDILSHEIGHWLGLYHTFQGGCTAPGDYIEDTPYEASSARECDEPRDTCDAPGDDPVHNYMDYAKDVCKNQFTPDQRIRMIDHWQVWRAPGPPK